jgi:hypothetical protein
MANAADVSVRYPADVAIRRLAACGRLVQEDADSTPNAACSPHHIVAAGNTDLAVHVGAATWAGTAGFAGLFPAAADHGAVGLAVLW